MNAPLCKTEIKDTQRVGAKVSNEQFFMYYLILCPLTRFSICSSMFMTVTLTFSRAKAVEKPLQNRNSIYSQSERIKRLCKHVLPSFVASIFLTIPWYWEFDVQYNFKTASGTPILLASDLRLDPMQNNFRPHSKIIPNRFGYVWF